MSSLPVVNWNLRATRKVRDIYYQISEDSLFNAKKVIDDISTIIDDLPVNPGRFPLDKWKRNNPGNYRAFEKHPFVFRIGIMKKKLEF